MWLAKMYLPLSRPDFAVISPHGIRGYRRAFMAFQMYVSLQDDNRIAKYLMDHDSGDLEPNGAIEISGGPAP